MSTELNQFKEQYGYGYCSEEHLAAIAAVPKRLETKGTEIVERHADDLDFEGNCFATVKVMMFDGDEDWVACHGQVYHEDTGWHAHGWVECQGWAMDMSNGHRMVLPADYYRSLGQCRNVAEYPRERALAEILRTGMDFPWEDDDDS